MAKRFEQRAYDVFNEKFEKALDKLHNHRDAFDAASDEIESAANFRIFGSYESFKNARSRRRKRK